jgi:hypothetical protein
MDGLKKQLWVLLSIVLLPYLDAAGATNSVTLAWNANSQPEVVGYRLHYGTASAPFSSVLDVKTTTATVSGLQTGATYTFAVTAYNTVGFESAYSQGVSVTPGSSRPIPTSILANVSTRTLIASGDNVMIGGFIIDGIVPKKVALRALGPSLAAFGLTGAAMDPFLQLVDSTGTVIASNDNWNVPGQEIQADGLAPADAREAALVATLKPGAYSAIVSDRAGGSGVGLFELYDLDSDLGRISNISTRSRVESGDNVMIGGFILNSPTANKLIVRAIGPSLAAVGVKGVLNDPTLDLYDSNGTLVASNDNWRSAQEAEISGSHFAPGDDREAAAVVTLAPGAYSSIVRSADGTAGVALVEVYALN